jgi:F-type H+-transporting ATPase subunit b
MWNPLDIQTGPILWTIINFTLLLVLLRAVAWKPIVKALETRESSINDALNRAEKAKGEAERVLAENQKALQRAEEESQKVLRDSREYAERLHSEATLKAQEEGRRILEQARHEIERSKQQALNELRGEVASLAVGGAERILRDTLDGDRQKRLVDEYLKGAIVADKQLEPQN